ncbi:MAG: alkaline metalloproteinase, partial [Caulobacter sp.]
DTVHFSGKWSDYTLTASGGTWTIKDNRAGAPEGQDVLRNVEFARFADRVVTNGFTLAPVVDTAFASILRADAATAMLSNITVDLVIKLAAGAPDAEVVSTLVQAADATTSVAAMAYQFFTGKIPTASGFDYLVAPAGPNPNNLNSAYYQLFNLENRYINFAVNLGKMGEGQAAFAAKYGALTLFEATREAYKTIFGGAPTDSKVHALIDTRVDYFASYGGDGANGLGTKAAMVGWLLAEAQKSDIGIMSRAVNLWLADVADASAPYAVNVLDPTKSYYNAGWLFDGNQ